MEVRLLKYCRQGETGEIVNIRPFFAKSLIKRGLAEVCEPVFRVGELCLAEIGKVQASEDYTWRKDDISDIAFWMETGEFAIFVHFPPRFRKFIFVGGDYYYRVSDGERYSGDNCINNFKIKKDDIVVNHKSVQSICDMDEELRNRGWDKNTELTVPQIKKFEQELNEKYHYWIGATKYVR